MKLSVVIPVYKNSEMFLGNLSKNWQFLKECEVIVVDDASFENIGQKIHNLFPEIIIIENTRNLGFSKTVNKGVKIAAGEFTMLLNSDVRLSSDSFVKATKHFADKELFAVSFAQKEKDGSLVGKNRIYFEKGLMLHKSANNVTLGLSGWAEGGACIIRKNFFDRLGGFDELYSPFYWEDIDLSYRAYKRGWKVLFDPEIVVEHHHESTIGKYYNRSKVTAIAYRNQFIFQWKNVTEKKLWKQHLLALPGYIIRALLRKDAPFIKGFIKAAGRFGSIIVKRGVEVREQKRTDTHVIQLTS